MNHFKGFESISHKECPLHLAHIFKTNNFFFLLHAHIIKSIAYNNNNNKNNNKNYNNNVDDRTYRERKRKRNFFLSVFCLSKQANEEWNDCEIVEEWKLKKTGHKHIHTTQSKNEQEKKKKMHINEEETLASKYVCYVRAHLNIHCNTLHISVPHTNYDIWIKMDFIYYSMLWALIPFKDSVRHHLLLSSWPFSCYNTHHLIYFIRFSKAKHNEAKKKNK